MANVGIVCFLFLDFLSCFSQVNPIKKVKYFDVNRLVISEIYFVSEKDGITKTGPYTAFYSGGKIKTKGAYSNDLAVGTWERYYENGILKSRYTYKDGKLNGPGILLFENGKTSQKGFFKNNFEDSTWTFYYESGRMKSKGPYSLGFQQGQWIYFHEDSTLKATAFIYKGRGHYKEFFLNKGVRMEGVIDNGLSDSIWKYYYENGNLKAIGTEKAGERDGFWRFYHSNGKISTEGHFSKNKKIGHWKYFHENGILSSEGTLENDEKEGIWKFFMPSGALMGQGVFSKGSGDYQEFYDNGKIKLKGKISNNDYEGPWTFYFEDGGLEGECLYKSGYGQYTGYYENGGIKMKGQMHNGQKVGSWDLIGKDNKLIGHYKTFYDLVETSAVTKAKPKNDSLAPKHRNYGRPEYNFSGKKIRHYVPKINEVKGFIVAFNPFALALTSFPIGIEYFFQDRLGFELMFTFYRQPFFANHAEELENKRVYTLGNSIDFRQKLYSADHGSGNLYIGQELRLSNFTHKLLVYESSDSTSFGTNYEGVESKIELSILVGNRFFQYYNKHNSFTLDLYTGIGFGYRYSNFPDQLLIYNRLKTNTLTIPFRLGFNFGYLF
jgi:antitoxin component YwqK of YwqJK toxin-antitoxin module